MPGTVMLRFAEGNPLNRETLFARTRLCAQAQRQHERGEDIIVPYGVEVVVMLPGATL